MNAHTPGPWRLEAGRSIVTPNGTFHLGYGHDKHGNPNFQDFCRLDEIAHQVAALPELLEALEGLLANAPAPKGVRKDFSYVVYREAAKKVIAKARGTA